MELEDSFIDFNQKEVDTPSPKISKSPDLPIAAAKKKKRNSYRKHWHQVMSKVTKTKRDFQYIRKFFKRTYVTFSFSLLRVLKPAFKLLGKDIDHLDSFFIRLKLCALEITFNVDEPSHLKAFCQNIIDIDLDCTPNANEVKQCAKKLERFEFDFFTKINKIGNLFNFPATEKIDLLSLETYILSDKLNQLKQQNKALTIPEKIYEVTLTKELQKIMIEFNNNIFKRDRSSKQIASLEPKLLKKMKASDTEAFSLSYNKQKPFLLIQSQRINDILNYNGRKIINHTDSFDHILKEGNQKGIHMFQNSSYSSTNNETDIANCIDKLSPASKDIFENSKGVIYDLSISMRRKCDQIRIENATQTDIDDSVLLLKTEIELLNHDLAKYKHEVTNYEIGFIDCELSKKEMTEQILNLQTQIMESKKETQRIKSEADSNNQEHVQNARRQTLKLSELTKENSLLNQIVSLISGAKKPTPLANNDNECYMNSIVQLLSPFMEVIKWSLSKSNQLLFWKLIAKFGLGIHKNIDEFKGLVRNNLKLIERHKQQDPIEILRQYLVSPTYIDSPFHFVKRQTYTCCQCNYQHIKDVDDYVLEVFPPPVKQQQQQSSSESSIPLQSWAAYSERNETIDGYFCEDGCKTKNTQANKTEVIIKPPAILLVQFRFPKDICKKCTFDTCKCNLVKKNIDWGTNPGGGRIVLNSTIYSVKGMILHLGSTGAQGHYITFTLRGGSEPREQQWFKCNDSSIASIEWNSVIKESKTAHLAAFVPTNIVIEE